jgi:hypothetical protein
MGTDEGVGEVDVLVYLELPAVKRGGVYQLELL